MDKIEFEKLLNLNKSALERFVYYKSPSKTDGDDILQETFLCAYKNMETMQNPESFKSWILRIAANKCNDFYRSMAKHYTIPYDDITDNAVSMNQHGISYLEEVRDTLASLEDKDKQILFLYYFKSKPQKEIAELLNIPLGTVKSRLHIAKQRFKESYTFPLLSPLYVVKKEKTMMGEKLMKSLPEFMPEYTIKESNNKSFEAPPNVRWEEMIGWFLVPRLGEKITWAMYDFPERKRSETTVMEVIGKASVHGIEGVEIIATEKNPREHNQTNGNKTTERRFIAQLTDTHCRILAESHMENDVRKNFTFLDSDDFLPNWGFGENNCGKEVNLAKKGVIQKNGSIITCSNAKQVMDVVGCYEVEINSKRYETVCLIDIESYDNGVLTEQFIDKNGKTVLWRRFNKNDWHFKQYNKLWTEMLPENEQFNVNSEIYVHWYDCLTDYIF